MLPRQSQKLCAMRRHKLLICCADTLSRHQRPLCKGKGRFHAAHRLHHNANLRILQDHFHIMNDFLSIRITRKLSQIQNIFYLQVHACLCKDAVMIRINDLHHTASDCTIA